MLRDWRVLAVLSVAAAVVVLSVWGCGGGGGGGEPAKEPPTAEELAAIEADSQQITSLAVSEGPAGYADVAVRAEQMPTVEAADAEGDMLTVQYREGGCDVYVRPPAWQQPSSWPASTAAAQSASTAPRPTELVGGLRAVLINAVRGDAAFDAYAVGLMDDADSLLTEMGYRVERLDGSACTYDAMKALAGASVVGYLGHGGQCDTFLGGDLVRRYALQTGQVWTRSIGQRYLADWAQDRIVRMHIPWGAGTPGERDRNGRWVVAVTHRFFSQYLTGANVLSRALFYCGACQGLKTDTMANALRGSGASAYVGWTDTQRYGPWTMMQLFRSMRSGMDLGKAMASMGGDLKVDEFDDAETGRHIRAELQYRPSSASSVQLETPGRGVDPFRVTLTWGRANDLDLHVFCQPSYHSYYAHKAIPAGELDVDDVDGYGPEHFTARSRLAGIYYVAANYYAERQDPGATSAYVQVETNSAVKTFGPRTLSAPNANGGYPVRASTSAWWRVCDLVVYSDGTVFVNAPDTSVALDNWGYYSVSSRHATQSPRKSYELQTLGIDPSLRSYLDPLSPGTR